MLARQGKSTFPAVVIEFPRKYLICFLFQFSILFRCLFSCSCFIMIMVATGQEKSGKFGVGQGNLEYCEKSGKCHPGQGKSEFSFCKKLAIFINYIMKSSVCN